MSDLNVPRISRRTLLGAVGAGAATASMGWAAVKQEVEALQKKGWSAHPVACCVCGARCGLLAMHKDGEKPSRKTVRILPNPDHPQRGYCGRGAQALWAWDHPMRIKKPLKRKGERGSGEFEEISWDQALNEIAGKLKAIVEKYGERSVLLTSHNFTAYQNWFAHPLGTPNVINHSSTCNSASTLGRRMIFGPTFSGLGKVEPDYSHVRYLLLVGRTLNCAMGVFSTAAYAREHGARLVFVDPRMPEGALGESEWIAIRPGTDAAFLHAIIHVGLKENLCDLEWVRKWTNAPCLVKDDLTPIVEEMVHAGGRKRMFAVIDEKTGEMRFQGPKLNDKGAPVGFDEDPAVRPALDWQGEVALADGSRVHARTVLSAFREVNNKYTPEAAAKLTGIPAKRIIETARDFFELGGVCDDGWYSSRNGNDVECYGLMNILNLFTGCFDHKGGCIITQGAGFGGPSPKKAGTKCTGPTGETWEVAPGKPMDKLFFPEGIGTLWTTFDAIKNGKPYPIRAMFMTGCSMFHREANSDRLIEAFKGLDLIVSQDILPQESNDWADYVLPSTFFLENHEYLGVNYALEGWVQKSDALLDPPEGVEARHDIWQFLEILRRMYPERAARMGYTAEIKDRAGWKKWFNEGLVDRGWEAWIAKKNAAKAGEGDRINAEVQKQGFSKVASKKYDMTPYKTPFTSPTGKGEIISFYTIYNASAKGIQPLPEYYQTKCYTQPKPNSNEFIIASGKNAASCAGVSLFTYPTRYVGDRTLWINPIDAKRLGIANGDTVEVEGLDMPVKGRTKVTVTNRVMPGVLFSYGFSSGVRTKKLLPEYEWVREGINTQWFATGKSQVSCGNMSNNVSVRIKRV